MVEHRAAPARRMDCLNAGCPALPRQVAMRSPEPDSHPLESIGNLADAAVLDGREDPEELPG